MSGFTRRTHVVRVTCPKKPPDIPAAFVEIEVLDAIAFKTTNGNDMILSLDSKDATAYITDDTGDGNEKKVGKATRRSHMKRMGSTFRVGDATAGPIGNAYDVEALDAIGFREQNGKVWILDMPQDDSRSFCVTDQTGNPRSTRRTHLEEIKSKEATGGTGGAGSTPGGTPGKITVERVDYIGFKTINGQTMIIKCPSADDGSAPRAETYISSPIGYDPNSDAPAPENTDPNVYIGWVFKHVPSTTVTQTVWVGLATYTGFADGEEFPGVHTFPVTTIQATQAEAIAAAQAFVESDFNQLPDPFGLGGFYRDPVSAVAITNSGVVPAFDYIGTLNTGGFKPDPDNPPPDPVVKVKMGPLWWIRKIQNGANSSQPF